MTTKAIIEIIEDKIIWMRDKELEAKITTIAIDQWMLWDNREEWIMLIEITMKIEEWKDKEGAM